MDYAVDVDNSVDSYFIQFLIETAECLIRANKVDSTSSKGRPLKGRSIDLPIVTKQHSVA